MGTNQAYLGSSLYNMCGLNQYISISKHDALQPQLHVLAAHPKFAVLTACGSNRMFARNVQIVRAKVIWSLNCLQL